MKNSIQLPPYNSQEETAALSEAMSMQKLLVELEEINMDPADYLENFKIAFCAMAKVHPDKAEQAVAGYAGISDLVRMVIENHESLVTLCNKYFLTQKGVEDRELGIFAEAV